MIRKALSWIEEVRNFKENPKMAIAFYLATFIFTAITIYYIESVIPKAEQCALYILNSLIKNWFEVVVITWLSILTIVLTKLRDSKVSKKSFKLNMREFSENECFWLLALSSISESRRCREIFDTSMQHLSEPTRKQISYGEFVHILERLSAYGLASLSVDDLHCKSTQLGREVFFKNKDEISLKAGKSIYMPSNNKDYRN